MRTCFPPDLYSLLLGQCLLHLVQPSAVQRTCFEVPPPESVRAGGACHPRRHALKYFAETICVLSLERPVMAAREKFVVESYDFLLVTTYMPVLALAVRAVVFIIMTNWLALHFWLQWHVVVMFTACVVYLDALTLASHSLDRTCGYLCVCALAVLAQPANAHECAEGVVVWGENFLWSFLSTFDLVSSASGVRTLLPFAVKVVLTSTLALLHAAGTCGHMGSLELIVRAVVFYLLCAMTLMCLKFTHVREHDRRTYVSMIPHVYAHVLFVHLYAALASLAIVLGLHVRMVVKHVQGSGDVETGRRLEAPKPESLKRAPEKRYEAAREERDEHSDLMRMFQAAKAASAAPRDAQNGESH